MGRYYDGDIEGKFFFGVQSSDDASFFGVEPSEPSHINYYFDDSNISEVEEGIQKCKDVLRSNKELIDKFFSEHNSYNDEMLMKYLELPKSEVSRMLEWYARITLGEKILKCLKENGSCSFDAEL